MIERILELSDTLDPVVFYGINNANIQLIKTLCPKLKIMARGNVVKVLGDAEDVMMFEEMLGKLQAYCAEFNKLDEPTIISIIKGKAPLEVKTDNLILHGVNGKSIVARTKNQQKLVKEFDKNDMLFAIGPAGSGKTYTAIALAVKALKNKDLKKNKKGDLKFWKILNFHSFRLEMRSISSELLFPLTDLEVANVGAVDLEPDGGACRVETRLSGRTRVYVEKFAGLVVAHFENVGMACDEERRGA